jgi:hypothetical protein
MCKSTRLEFYLTAGPQLIEDPEELQLLDEYNSKWVEAWKAAAKKTTALKAQAICAIKCGNSSR